VTARAPRFLLALGLAALVAGCEDNSVRVPRTTQTYVLSIGHPQPDVEMELVSAIHVVLPGPKAGSGLTWEIASNNVKVLEQMGPLKVDTAAGAAVTTSVSFFSLMPGWSTLRFFLVHPDQAETVPVATCTMAVRVRE
jgi:hypothetical protein